MPDRTAVVASFTPSVVLDLAASTGRLDAAGVAVREVPVTSSPGQFRSLLDDEIQVALTSPDNVLAYRYNPANPLGTLADVRMVAAVDDTPEDAPPELQMLAREARTVLKGVTDVLAAPETAAAQPPSRAA